MKIAPDAQPLRPEEIRAVRRFLRTQTVEEHLEPAEVAKRLKLSKRKILDLVQEGEFPHATKPFPNRVRIPVSDVVSFLTRNRVKPVQASAPQESEVSHG
jgi:excisionase family DNA binding protein